MRREHAQQVFGASYLERYNVLCRELTQERLYTTATLLASPRTPATTGEYAELCS